MLAKIFSPTLLLLSLLQSLTLQAQSPAAKLETRTEGGYSYQTLPGDPLGARFYKLPNGLTVILSVNKAEPRLYTMIAVKAGSKYDPADNTGLAHYLEHMLFKGTDRFGTQDYAREKALLDQIEAQYNRYNQEKDPARRKAIYARIDSLSGLAGKLAIPNEYDKMVNALGATGTNAFTSNEMTVYVNDIPSNEIERWLTIESERFRSLQLRLFHTELEAVYEEKNISLDNDARRASEELYRNLYPTHPYGQQTTIGTVEHLKNPNWGKIKNYFQKYYVPNNMAIVLAGDLDPTAVMKEIEKRFGNYKAQPVAPYSLTPEKPLAGPIERSVSGPDRENVTIGYRLPGRLHADMPALKLISQLLLNGEVGLIDLNLNQAQKVLQAGAYLNDQIDYSTLVLSGQPREGQSLEDVRDLMLAELDKVLQGQLDASLIPAIIKNLKIQRLRGYENNRNRAYTLMYEFVTDAPWTSYSLQLEQMATLSPQALQQVAQRYFTPKNRVVVYKRSGPKDQVVKIEKPSITPVALDRSIQSPFVEQVMNMPTPSLRPAFLDFSRDLEQAKLGASSLPVLAVRNTDNELFTLYYHFEMGAAHNRLLPLAIDYLNYIGTSKYSAEELRKKFYALGCSFGASTSEDQSFLYLSGLQESFAAGVALFEELLQTAKADRKVYEDFIAGILKKRQNAKKDKSVILNQALRNYAIYGPQNPFTYIVPEADLRALDPSNLTELLGQLTQYPHKVLYYGPLQAEALVSQLAPLHGQAEPLLEIPRRREFTRQATPAQKVYMVDYEMVQAQLMWVSRTELSFEPIIAPIVSMYNEYFGGNMSSIVFQTIRESKALAYSTSSRLLAPDRRSDPYYNLAYVGTQADKLLEAHAAMRELLTEMPESELGFANARRSLLNTLASERITRQDILFEYLRMQRLGLNRDLREEIYTRANELGFDQVREFQTKFVSAQPHVLLLLGSRERIRASELEKLGTVEMLSLEQIFGY